MLSEPISIDDPAAAAIQLRELVPQSASVAAPVAEIIERVRTGGDRALADMVARFDAGESPPPPLRASAVELENAERELDASVRAGLAEAYENVLRVASAGVAPDNVEIETGAAQIVLREEPVPRAAIYVPGGRAPYPSTVVMGVATARAAGVGQIVVCSPPTADERTAVVLGACALVKVDEVYRMGGAHAVAALAFGTETLPGVDVVVGPGNLYVQEAKRQLSEQVGTDGFAGPSDLLVVVEHDAEELDAIVLDLLAQAEHGPGTLIVGVSTSRPVLDALYRRMAPEHRTEAVIRLVHVASIGDALELAQALAPEHVQLVGAAAEALAPRVTRAGCVFVGANSGTAFGDYIVGSNHVLPTGGTARFASGLTPANFRRRFAEVRVLDAAPLARAAGPVARAEGFELHARSMEARIRDNR